MNDLEIANNKGDYDDTQVFFVKSDRIGNDS